MPDFSFFHPAVSTWFRETFAEPSPPQALGWPLIAQGKNVLLLAPTGSGKTLAAFLQCLNWLYQRAEAGEAIDNGVQVLYISPLKALNNDIHRNLELPLNAINQTAEQLGLPLPRLRSAIRTGDTPNTERRAMLKRPPHILITTPESLFLMLCSKARDILKSVRFVIIDEIHSLFPTKRGAHLSLSLEYLGEICGRPFQRIGLSATQRPLDQVAAFLGGGNIDPDGRWIPRPVEIVDTGQRKQLDLRIELPVPDLRELPEKSIWPEIYRQLLELVQNHQSTLIFVNGRAQAERIAANLNGVAGFEVARVHHGSLSREVRFEVESLLKAGRLRCLVATSSLELGIDIGSIDLVVQVESPHEVARGLQRVGRAGHLVGMPSKGRIIPKTRGDLLEAAAIIREMAAGRIERSKAPENCLDVLAQQVIGLTVDRSAPVDDLFRLVRQAYGYARLPRSDFERILAMLAGQFGADEFVDLRPRVYWDQVNGEVRASPGGKRLIYTSGGTIPDRGYYGVYMADSPVRLGELDEEFVYERRLGDRFMLGTTTWQIDEFRQDRVIVSSAKGYPTVPFWKGEGLGRPYEFGCTYGRFLGQVGERLNDPDLMNWLQQQCLLDQSGARNLRDYLLSQREATGVIPSDRSIVIEEFPDELGDWRVLIHSVFGQRINTPLAMLLTDQLRAGESLEVESTQTDDGLLFLEPAAPNPPFLDLEALEWEDLEGKLAGLVSTTPLFGLFFRHNAARALILPRGAYGKKRTPLWLARLKAADLLQVVHRYPSFPIVMETYREILSEVFDLRGLREVIVGLRTGAIQVHRCRRTSPSPFAQPFLFGLVAAYMYEPDTPKAERRLHSLALDRQSLRKLLGETELRKLLDPQAIAQTVLEARGVAEGRRPRSADELHAWLLRVGDWRVGGEMSDDNPVRSATAVPSAAAVSSAAHFSCTTPDLQELLMSLVSEGRAVRVAWDGGRGAIEAWIAAESLPYYRAALGSRLSVANNTERGSSDAHQDISEEDGRDSIIRRFVRTNGPFLASDLERVYGFSEDETRRSLARLEAEGLVQAGKFLPDGVGTEWCDVTLLQQMHRRSQAKARREVEPRTAEDHCSFLARWQGIGSPGSGIEGLVRTLEQLEGLSLPAGLWEGGVLPARVQGYRPQLLDQALGSGLFTWIGDGAGDDIRVVFSAAGRIPRVRQGPSAPRLQKDASVAAPGDGAHPAQKAHPDQEAISHVANLLKTRGALFLPQIWQQTGLSVHQAFATLEQLLRLGQVTNDTFGPVRYLQSYGTRDSGNTRVLGPAILGQMGRWSILDRRERPTPEDGLPGLAADPGGPGSSEALCDQLLARYGIVTKDVAIAEGIPWSLVSRTFEKWEITGKVRRGYFVKGLAGAQYARGEAVEGLRLPRDAGLPEFWGLVTGDPANPWGTILPWPESQPRPSAPILVVCRAGSPVLSAQGKNVKIQPLAPLKEEELVKALTELKRALGWARREDNRVDVSEWDGQPILETPAGEILEELGLERGYKGLIWWTNNTNLGA